MVERLTPSEDTTASLEGSAPPGRSASDGQVDTCGATMMTGGQALAHQLRVEGVRHVFGVPGAQLDWAVDGLARLDGAIQLWTTRHEQGAGYMADGYARATGGAGTFMVVPGPGLLNAAAALATGYACSSRMLAVVGQLPSRAIGRGWGMLHEVPDQSRLLASLTKWSAMATRPEDVPRLLRQAMVELNTGRPRPVAVEIPPDVLAATASVRLVPPVPGPTLEGPAVDDLYMAVKLLREACTPVIVAGGGVVAAGASAMLADLAGTLGAPVGMTRNGRGALSDRHSLAVGPLGLPDLLARADVVLVVGSRFMTLRGEPITVAPGARVVLVNADPADVATPRPATVRMVSDAVPALALLADAVRGAGGDRAAQAARWAEDVRQSVAAKMAGLEPQLAYVGALRDAIPDDGIFVNELTQVGYVAGLAYPVYEPRTFVSPGYQGTLGYGFPTALGTKAAMPDTAVVSITGDGGFGWCLAELATARRHRIATVTVVFDDGAFGNVQRTQKEEFDGRVYGTDLVNPDFVALAKSFGVAATTATSPDELRAVVGECLATDEPSVVVVPIDECPSPWELIAGVKAKVAPSSDGRAR